MDTVMLAISLPPHGSAWDYAEAISMAIATNPDMMAQQALSGLLSHIRTSAGAMPYTEGRSQLVFGKFP